MNKLGLNLVIGATLALTLAVAAPACKKPKASADRVSAQAEPVEEEAPEEAPESEVPSAEDRLDELKATSQRAAAAQKARQPVAEPEPKGPTIENNARAESIMHKVGRPFSPLDAQLNESQLEVTKANAVAAYKTNTEPKIVLFLFEYDTPKIAHAHIATVITWIANSGLVQNPEATLSKHAIVVIGTEQPGDLDADTKALVDSFMDAAIMVP